MAFEIDPIEFLRASRKANAATQSKISNMDFSSLGNPSLFATSKRKSRDIEDSTTGFEDLSSSGLINEDNTNALLGVKADELGNAANNIGLMAGLEVKEYGAKKQADEMARREALQRAQCQKSKKGGLLRGIGRIVAGDWIGGGLDVVGGISGGSC